MSWTYSSNVMGPYGLWWYDKHNVPYIMSNTKGVDHKVYTEQWYGGRIDCYCNDIRDIDYDHYGREIYLPIMLDESLDKLDKYLDQLTTSKLLTWEELQEKYEKETGDKLQVFEEGRYATTS